MVSTQTQSRREKNKQLSSVDDWIFVQIYLSGSTGEKSFYRLDRDEELHGSLLLASFHHNMMYLDV